MKFKHRLLSGLFSLFAGSALLVQGNASHAATCSWLNSPLRVGNNILLRCKATVTDSGKVWNKVRYICSGPSSRPDQIFDDFSVSMTPNQSEDCPDTGAFTGLASGTYDCIAIASGTTAPTWDASTGDTNVVVP